MKTSGIRRGLLSSAIVATTVLLGAGTAGAESIESITDNYLFSTSLSQFEKVRGEKPHADKLDWSSDSCSWAPDKPVGFDFNPACHRHDFGYRNYKKQSRFDDTGKKRIDDNFYSDLKGICNGNGGCNALAWTYYQAVRKLGS